MYHSKLLSVERFKNNLCYVLFSLKTVGIIQKLVEEFTVRGRYTLTPQRKS